MPFLSTESRQALLNKMDSAAQKRFQEILSSYKSDLTTNLRGQFAPSDFVKIIDFAGSCLEKQLSLMGSLTFADVDNAWHSVVTDFFRSGYWGFALQHQEYKDDQFGLGLEALEPHEQERILSRDNLKKAMPYLRQFVIGLIIWKILVIYLAQKGCFDWGILKQ